MKTDVDSALRELVTWFVTHRRNMTEADLEPILKKHCENEAEVRKFVAFLGTEPGQLRFKTLLRESKEQSPPRYLKEPLKHYWVEKNVPYETWAVVEAFPGGTVRSPFNTKEEAIKLEEEITEGIWELKQVPSPQEKFPKQHEALKKLYPYEFVEYHDDGDLTIQLLVPKPKPQVGFKKGELIVVTTDGRTFKEADKTSYLKEGKKYVVLKSTGSLVSWDSWLKELESYQRRGETPPPVEYPPLKCKYCGVVVPKDANPEVWAGYHIKRHKEAVKELAEKRLPWSAGLVPIETSYLKEAVAETECQLISPQYYDVLTWLNVPVPDYSFAIEPEVKERKIDEVLQKLKDGVSRIHESAIFREFLVTMSKFWDYSFGNQILIMLQRPGATRVAGIKTWNELGRYVRRGERGIAILAPCLPPKILKCPLCEKTFTEWELRKHLVEVHQRKDVSTLVREAREEAAVVPAPTYFKVVNVFDVSQTEGKPLPEIVVPVLSGAYIEVLYTKLMQLAVKYSLSVSFEPRPELSSEIKGTLLGKEIWVKGDETEAQRLKTLAHEEAHYFTESVYFIPRADAEVIAESVAFVVCAHSGFDTGTRSFPYVALWAKEKKVLEQNLATIRKISGRMIEELGG